MVCYGPDRTAAGLVNGDDALAERSKAVAQGTIPEGRGFEPHRRHFLIPCHVAAAAVLLQGAFANLRW